MGHGAGHAHRLTSSERSELQRRVRAGETHKSAAAAVGCSAKSVQRLLAKTGGVKSRASRDRPCGCRWPSARRSREDCSPESRGAPLDWAVRPPPWRVKSRAPEVGSRIARGEPTSVHVGELAARSVPSWQHPLGFDARCNGFSSCAGPHSRSPRDFSSTIPMIRRCACRTRRSISRSSCRAAGRFARSWPDAYGPGEPNGGRSSARTEPVNCSTWCSSASAPLRFKIERFRATGKATSSSARVRSRPLER